MKSNIDEARDLIDKLYSTDNRPWTVGYSGGKDSTLVLQLICEVAKKYNWKNPVFVMYNKTGLEADGSLDELDTQLKSMARIGITTFYNYPRQGDSFWELVCGRGYPAPSRRLRFCTSYLKLDPWRRRIVQVAKDSTAKGVIDVKGTRKEESTGRLKRLEKEGAPYRLTRFRKQLNIELFPPVANVKTNELWSYLEDLHTFEWGGTVDELKERYLHKQARDGCWICPFCTKEDEIRYRCNESQIRVRKFFFALSEDVNKRNLCTNDRQRERVSEGTASGRFTLEARKELFDFIMNEQEKTGYIYIKPEEIAYIKTCWEEYENNPFYN